MMLPALVAAGLAGAVAQDADPMRQLGAHVHGEAQLAVAADPSGLVLAELTSPAYNLYGFETAPETDEQRSIIESAHAALAQPGLLSFPARAGCALTDTALESGAADDDHASHAHEHGGEHHEHAHDAPHDHAHTHEHDGHDHDDHEHGHDHDDHGRDDHGHDDHGHDHAHDGEHAHADVVVSWSFQCERPDAIDRLDAAGLFAAFARFETLDAQFFDGGRAAAGDLTAQASVLTIE